MLSPYAYVHMHALKGLACRAHATLASSHALPCSGEALTLLSACHARGFASPFHSHFLFLIHAMWRNLWRVGCLTICMCACACMQCMCCAAAQNLEIGREASPDTFSLVSAATDGSVKLWRLKATELIVVSVIPPPAPELEVRVRVRPLFRSVSKFWTH